MRILIIYHSEHHGNTKKIAEAIAGASGATILKAENTIPEDIEKHEIIGFGSGVYNGRLHVELSDIIDKVQEQDGRKAFIFSTTGSKTYSAMAHDRFRPVLEKKGFKVIGEFSCLGFDTAITSEGINKGKPDEQDIKDASAFIQKIL